MIRTALIPTLLIALIGCHRHRSAEGPEPPLSVEPTVVWRAYQENAAGADQRYKGRTIRWNCDWPGRVMSNGSGYYCFQRILSPGWDAEAQGVMFYWADQNEAGRIDEQHRYEVEGIVKGMDDRYLIIGSTRIVNVNDPPKPKPQSTAPVPVSRNKPGGRP